MKSLHVCIYISNYWSRFQLSVVITHICARCLTWMINTIAFMSNVNTIRILIRSIQNNSNNILIDWKTLDNIHRLFNQNKWYIMSLLTICPVILFPAKQKRIFHINNTHQHSFLSISGLEIGIRRTKNYDDWCNEISYFSYQRGGEIEIQDNIESQRSRTRRHVSTR